MIQFPTELKPKVVAALMEQRNNFDGTDKQFAKQWGINHSVFSRIKTAENFDGLLRDAQWLNIARELDISLNERKWNVARTEVFEAIEEDVLFCQMNSKSLMLVDDCGIGKSFTAKYLSRSLKNCFYVDCTQCPTKAEFIRTLAKAIGVDENGKLMQIRANIKYALKTLPSPCVIVDEAGALNYEATMCLKEFWNATEKACGWYMMGADGLRAKMEASIRNKKVGFAELFSRYNERYNTIVPVNKDERIAFYTKLITDVLTVNIGDKRKIPAIVNKCLTNDSGRISGLRRAETLVMLNAA